MPNAPSWIDGNDNWQTPSDWSTGSIPGSGDAVTVAQGDPQVTTNVGSIGSLNVSARLDLSNGGALLVTGAATDTGTIGVDAGYATGGSSLTINGTLTNPGTLAIGNAALSADTVVSVGALTNFVGVTTGTVNLTGNATHTATLNVGGSAGFGGTGSEIGAVNLTGKAVIQFATGHLTAVHGSLTLDGAGASIDIQGQGANSALTTLASVSGSMTLLNGNSVSTAALTNTGTIGVDSGYATGGSTLTIGGGLTNTGTLNIGNAALTADSLVNVSSITNFVGTATGTINLTGGPNGSAILEVSGAAGFGTGQSEIGTVSLTGDAVIDFGTGQIATILGSVTLNGASASIQDAGQGINSALTGLQTVSGSLTMLNGATVATGPVTNTGTIGVDSGYDTGGSDLTIGGALTSSGTLNFGNSALSASVNIHVGSLTNVIGATTGTINVSGGPLNAETGLANEALLAVNGPAGFGTVGSVVGSVNLYQDGVILFTGGQIGTIGAGSELTLNGAMASVSNDGNINSALTGLQTVAGSFTLLNGATVTATGPLGNTGTIGVDSGYDTGGSSLTVDNALTNSRTLTIGNSALNAPTTVTVGSLTNFAGTTHGTINVSGGAANPQTGLANAALLSVGTPAGFGTAGSLIGSVNLYQDGQIQFASGTIDTITSGSELTLNGAMSSVTNGGGTNSALTGLQTVAGAFNLANGATATINGPLSNTGTITVDSGYNTGGSGLTIKGTLTNPGTLSIGNSALSTATTVTVGSLVNSVGNTDGTIDVTGGPAAPQLALLSVGGAAGFGTTGSLIGSVNLYQDAQITFASGGIGTITTGSELTLNGALTSIGNGGGTNSALTGLQTISGSLTLQNGAAVTTGAGAGTANTLSVGNMLTVSGGVTATNIAVQSGGTLVLTGGSANGAVTVASGGTFEGIGSAGSVTVASGGTFAPGADPGILNTGSITLVSGATFGIEIGGTASGAYDQDVVASNSTVSLGGATLSGTLVNSFTPALGDTFEIINNTGSSPISGTFAGLAQGATLDIGNAAFTISYTGGDGNDVVLTDVGMACYARGTRIMTATGPVAVEHLAVGDRVVTASGERRPIRWLGCRTIDCRAHPDPRAVWPIRVAAHAFGPNRPERDLFVSPDHALGVTCLDDVLVPAARLLNGSTIARHPVDTVTYWHVELDSHDMLLAEGLPAESYLEVGNRWLFAQNDTVALQPGLAADQPRREADFCRPFVEAGPMLDMIRARLAARAERLGWTARDGVDVHLMADGHRIDGLHCEGAVVFLIEASARDVRLVSGRFVPDDFTGMGDRRQLGTALLSLSVLAADGTHRPVPLDDPRLADGFFAAEVHAGRPRRWTTGDAALDPALWADLTGAVALQVSLDRSNLRGWTAPRIASEMLPSRSVG